MLDGLRSEFPEAGAAVRRIPHPRVAHASLFWSVMAAFGAGLLVSSIATIVFSFLLQSVSRDAPIPAPFELARIAATGAALAVAWGTGGRNALTAYLVLVVLEDLLSLPGRLRFCAGVGANAGFADVCSPARFVIALWPQMFGVALAFALVRWIRAAEGDRNPTLEAAGVFAFVQAVAVTLLSVATVPVSAGTPVAPLSILIIAIGAGVAMGYTLLTRASRTWRTFGIVAVIIGSEFVLVSLPLFVSQVMQARGTNLLGPLDLAAYFSQVFAIAAAAIVLYIAAARKVTAAQSS
jgi:hypothetical protein